jgi:hypothetical protein
VVCSPRDEEDEDACDDEAEKEFWGRGSIGSERENPIHRLVGYQNLKLTELVSKNVPVQRFVLLCEKAIVRSRGGRCIRETRQWRSQLKHLETRSFAHLS